MSRLRADNLTNRAATGAPLFTHGATVTGVVTATSFDGNVTGNADTATTATTAINAQGLTGSPDIIVSNVTAGIITATSFAGNGASVTSIDAGNISSGIVTSARLGSGTANSTTFLNGHGQFAEAGGGAWEYISKVTLSSSVSSIDFTTNIDSTYDHYVFVGRNLVPSADSSDLWMKYFTAGGLQEGTSYDHTSNPIYNNTLNRSTIVNQPELRTSDGNAQVGIDNVASLGGTNFEYHLINPSGTSANKLAYGYRYNVNSFNNGGMSMSHFAHRYKLNTAVTGVRFLMSGGNMASGTIILYGIKES